MPRKTNTPSKTSTPGKTRAPRRKQSTSTVTVVGDNVVSRVSVSGKARVKIVQKSTHGKPTNDPELEKLFKLLEKQLKSRPEDPNVDKKEISSQLEQIKAESAQGEKANPKKLERWIRNLAGMAPDIIDVITASLGGPVSGFTAVLQKIAAKVKAESAGKA